jgi:hypothetical protein
MPLDLNSLTPDQLKALLAQSATPSSSTPAVDAALSSPTPTEDTIPDRSGMADKITDYINNAVPSGSVQALVDEANGKGYADNNASLGALPNAIISSKNTDLPTDLTPEPTGDTGLSPSVDQKFSKMTQDARDAMAASPNASSPDEEDEPSSSVRGSPVAKGSTPSDASSGPKDYLGDMMAKLYGPGNDANALRQAQQTRNSIQGMNNLSMSDQMIAAAMSRGGFKPDYAVNAEIAQQANNPVNNILQQRQAQEGQIATALKLSDFNDKSQQQDPNSPLSQSARAMALQLNPQLQKAPDFKTMDYEAIVKLQPMVDTSLKAQAVALQRQMMMGYKQNQAESKAEFDAPNKISNFINNRGATKLAADADRRVDNLTSLVALYPNLDNMPQNQVHLFTDELAQIATGGVAREGSTAQLMSPTLLSGMKQLLSKGTDNVTGAEMGNFLKEYQPYLQDLQQNARAYVGDQIKPLVNGAQKSIQDPVAYGQLKAGYDRYLSASDARKQTQQAVKQVAPTPQGAPGSTPHDAAAIQWAKENINNPDPKIKSQALQFIKVNGG